MRIEDDTQVPMSPPSSANGMRRFREWAKRRSLPYLTKRLTSLLRRYGISAAQAERRTLEFVELLGRYGCSPTLAVPGRVVRRHGPFIRELQDRGVELAIHGFDHVDFRTLDPSEVTAQLARAASAFEANDIRFSGFRCPYLSYDVKGMAALVPPSVFAYSSNEAIEWRAGEQFEKRNGGALYATLTQFYRASSASDRPSVPRSVDGLVEIPASLPDDLQVLDGSKAGEAGLAELWLDILHRTHSRGEAFVVLTHPETARLAAGAFIELLEEARRLSPPVWVTRVHEVSEWWRHRTITIDKDADATHIRVPERATLLARNIPGVSLGERWDVNYRVVDCGSLSVPSTEPLPFVGLAADVPSSVRNVLKDEGFVVETGDAAPRCATVLDLQEIQRFGSELALLNYLDALPNPLVRVWRWPDRARSALCISGDLDALSLIDYADRVFAIGPFARS